uniref:Putative da-p36 protein n=1 Tax=Rhipicephalus pulchellus TaxID=72859 RepID=L7LTC1_RHIPC
MIKQAITAGILFCLIIRVEVTTTSRRLLPKRGECQKVDLVKEAKAYVAGRGEGLEVLNFTNAPKPKTMRPLQVTVGTMHYEGACGHNGTKGYPDCKDVFWWFIKCSISNPLNFTVNVTVPYKGRPNHILPLELNNATSVQWNPYDLPNDSYHQQHTESTTCNFTVEVGFEGQFYYKVRKGRGDKPKDDTIGVTELVNREKGLFVHEKKLIYDISGWYKHEVVCLPKEQLKKKAQVKAPRKSQKKKKFA